MAYDVEVADLDQGIPFPSGSFDIVNANQVIEHVRRTDVLLREMRRVVKPNGLVCISTNNLASWHNVVSLGLGMQPMPMHVSDEIIVGNPLNPENRWGHRDLGRTHLRLFTARALSELAAHHGLAVEQIRSVGYYPLPPLLARLATRVDPVHGPSLCAYSARSSARMWPLRAQGRGCRRGLIPEIRAGERIRRLCAARGGCVLHAWRIRPSLPSRPH